jgi:glycosyltransferase involved in cell wall biosynthesis/ADP-heptose:LPS heptosyltransferase
MACGAPVITSNATSLPEVVGRADATFDPHSSDAIAKKIESVLADESLRVDLGRYGIERARQFSWDICAAKAIAAMEKVASKHSTVQDSDDIGPDTPKELSTAVFSSDHVKKKILISKLDHMGDWILAIPAISKLRARYPYAEIDALVGSWNVEAAKNLGLFKEIYSFDFFSKKSSVTPRLKERALNEILDRMPDYDLAIDLRRQSDTRAILLRVPAKQYAGYSTADERVNEKLDVRLEGIEDERFVRTALNLTPMPLQMTRLVDAIPSDVNDYIFLPKQQTSALQAKGRIAIFPRAGNDVKEWGDQKFIALIEMLLQAEDVHAVTIYTIKPGDGTAYAGIRDAKFKIQQGLSHADLLNSLREHFICISNNSYGGHLASYLGLSVVGVYGGHETPQEWGPAFGKSVVLYAPVECSPCHIGTRAECAASMKCLEDISPTQVYAAVRRMFDNENGDIPQLKTIDDVVEQLIEAVAPLAQSLNDEDCAELAACIDRSIGRRRHTRWYVDISELARHDAKTGIQRVDRSILKCWLETPPPGVDIVPVYAGEPGQGYCRASRFLAGFTDEQSEASDTDDLVDFQAGDVFIGLDLNPGVTAQQGFLRRIRNQGVLTYFVVYDMLPAKMPGSFFDEGVAPAFAAWLRVVAEANGALCISRAVEAELSDWLCSSDETSQQPRRPFQLVWFHLGADIDNSRPTSGLPGDWQSVEAMTRRSPCFLMVGTLEPRKGHAEVLDAFEKLWADGVDASLVIVGKKGWHVEGLAKRIHEQPMYMQSLAWLEAVSDECLQRVYSEADCLIAASLGEGFGLPLIEAAQHGLPILARDIPVFREVAGDYATYFGTAETPDLAGAIKNWLKSYTDKRERSSVGMPFMTWKQSAEMLAELILSKTKSQSISSDASILTVSVQPTNSPNRALA